MIRWRKRLLSTHAKIMSEMLFRVAIIVLAAAAVLSNTLRKL